MNVFATLAEAAVDAIFPLDCGACGQRLPGRELLCADCELGAELIREPCCPSCGLPEVSAASECPDCRGLRGVEAEPLAFDRARSRYVYGGAIERSILRFKFGGAAHLALAAGETLAQAMQCGELALQPDFDCVIPIPVGKARLRQRGFDQAVLMARAFGRVMRRRVQAQALWRQRETQPQAQRGRVQRQQNVHGAFALRSKSLVNGKKILLLDDVMTTGFTALAAAQVLRQAGARRVEVLTLARANLDDHAIASQGSHTLPSSVDLTGQNPGAGI